MNCILPAPGGTIAGLFFLMLFSTQSMAQEAVPPGENTESEPVVEKKKEEGPGRGRFLALPVFITEPAIGEGLGGALMYFHGKKDADEPSINTADDIGKTDRKKQTANDNDWNFCFWH